MSISCVGTIANRTGEDQSLGHVSYDTLDARPDIGTSARNALCCVLNAAWCGL